VCWAIGLLGVINWQEALFPLFIQFDNFVVSQLPTLGLFPYVDPTICPEAVVVHTVTTA
jgi:hypothetical protein